MSLRDKAVIFDLDGVLTDTAEYHYMAWKQLADELGVVFTKSDNERLKGVSRMDSLGIILTLGDKQHSFDAQAKEHLAAQKNAHYVSLIQNITPEDMLPGMRELLERLRQSAIPIGLASVSKNAFTVVERLGISDLLDAIVDARTIKKSKPDPEVFLRAAEMLGVRPQDCIGVEDAVEGVKAIKAAGMYAVAVGENPKLTNLADETYPSTTELSRSPLFRLD
jgi:beta-phosphoglucomutase